MSEVIGDVTRDESLDVMELLGAGTTEVNISAADPAFGIKPGDSQTPKIEKPMSALERAIALKKNGSGGIEDDAEATAEEQAPLRPAWDTDEAREDFIAKMGEISDDTDKAQAVVVVKKPTNQAEYAKLITEVSSVTLLDDGTAVVPEGSEYIVAKTPEIAAYLEERKLRADSGNADDENVQYRTVDETKETYKKEIVQILIDKTGMGMNITFDDEDKKAIERADLIQLYEVEDKELRVVDVERMDDSVPFMQAISARQASVCKVPMAFPGSGFKADMFGMSWGEFADVTLDTISDNSTDLLNFDKLYRRYSVIYNKMKNISVGPFKDFDDFLHHFAHDDSELAVYGLTLATQPDNDSLYLNCTKEGCKKRFLYRYNTRSVIDLDTASIPFLEMLDKLETATPDERYSIFKNSKVNKFKRVRLDISGYLVDIGLASAWDYLYQILPIIREYDALEEQMDADDPRRNIPFMLFGVRNIFVPLQSGGYARASTAKDIADAILSLPTQDALVLEAAVQAFRARYFVGFSLKDIECPHCGTKTKRIPIEVDQLVFQIRLHQSNTHVRVKNFQDF